MQSAEENVKLIERDCLTFSYQIDVLCRDEIIAFVYRKPIEEPVNLRCRMRVNHALNFCLQPRPRVDDGARNFDFWCN